MLRDLASAGIRLNIIGPLEACRVQVSLFPKLEALLTTSWSSVELDSPTEERALLKKLYPHVDFYQYEIPQHRTIQIDLLQARHGLLYSRLFSS